MSHCLLCPWYGWRPFKYKQPLGHTNLIYSVLSPPAWYLKNLAIISSSLFIMHVIIVMHHILNNILMQQSNRNYRTAILLGQWYNYVVPVVAIFLQSVFKRWNQGSFWYLQLHVIYWSDIWYSYIREYKTIANSVVEHSKCYKCILCVLLVHQILLSIAASTGPKLIPKNEKWPPTHMLFRKSTDDKL